MLGFTRPSLFVVIAVASLALSSAACKGKKDPAKNEPATEPGATTPTGNTPTGNTPTGNTPTGTTPTGGDRATPPPSRTIGVKVGVGGTVLELKHGLVRDPIGRGTPMLALSAEPGNCDKDPEKYIEIALPPARGGKFSAGKPIAVPVVMRELKMDADDVPSYLVTVTLDPVQRKKGSRVTGTIDAAMIKDGKNINITGAFDAEMCNDFEGFEPAPETVADSAITGKVKDKDFTAKSAIVWLKRDQDNKVDYLERLTMFPEPNITCAGKSGLAELSFTDLGGADSKHKLVGGTASPDGSMFVSNTDQTNVMGQTWVRFDSFELKKGGVLKGALFNKEGDRSQLAGTFAAEICE